MTQAYAKEGNGVKKNLMLTRDRQWTHVMSRSQTSLRAVTPRQIGATNYFQHFSSTCYAKESPKEAIFVFTKQKWNTGIVDHQRATTMISPFSY